MSRRDVAVGLIAGGLATLPFPAHAARRFDVRDHGARGDGRAIDSNAINAAILAASAGKTDVQAASIYSVYNVAAVVGKVLSAVFISLPSLKKGLFLYLLFPLLYCLSPLLLLNVSVTRWLSTGSLLDALAVTQSDARLVTFCVAAGLGYGFGASVMALLVKEFFGLADLTRLQPLQYACVIFGNELLKK